MRTFHIGKFAILFIAFCQVSATTSKPDDADDDTEDDQITRDNRAIEANPVGQTALLTNQKTALATVNGKTILGIPVVSSPISNPALKSGVIVAANGPLAGLSVGARAISNDFITTTQPSETTTFWGYLPEKAYPFVLPAPDIPYFGSKWVGPWGYPIGHYQAFRGTGQYITHYSYYPLSYFGSLMAPFAYGMSGKK